MAKDDKIRPEKINHDFEFYRDQIQMIIDAKSPEELKMINGSAPRFNGLLNEIYAKLFRPNHAMPNHEQSNLNYDDLELLDKVYTLYAAVAGKFGMYTNVLSFCVMTGLDKDTVNRWGSEKTNHERYRLIQKWNKDSENSMLAAVQNHNSIGNMFLLKAVHGYNDQPIQRVEVYTPDNKELSQEVINKYIDDNSGTNKATEVIELPDDQ